jgi:hypothetical protein
MADQVILPRAMDENGNVVAGAQAFFYARGTDTVISVYADEDATVARPQPVLASSAGAFPQVFTSQPVKLRITDPAGAVLPGYPQDPAALSLSRATSAGAVPVTPYPGDGEGVALTSEDVQAALEELADAFAGAQVADANLDALAGLTTAANKIVRWTGPGTAALVDFLDEDDMASDSATGIPTQQSVKAYVDAQVAGVQARLATAVDATGATVDLTDLPAGVDLIRVCLSNVSTNGTSDILLQIGPVAGVETTSYDGFVEFNGNATTATSGFILTRLTGAADVFSGILTLAHIGDNVWVESGSLTAGGVSSGRKAIAGPLSILRLTTIDGTDTFDGGKINIIYS